MVEIDSRPVQLALVLHTAVDHLHGQGAGIDRYCAPSEPSVLRQAPSKIQLYSEPRAQVNGFTREQLVVFENSIKMSGRAQMLAIVQRTHGAWPTRRSSELACLPAWQPPRESKSPVFCDSLKAVHQDIISAALATRASTPIYHLGGVDHRHW
jgi:hypothetical protein